MRGDLVVEAYPYQLQINNQRQGHTVLEQTLPNTLIHGHVNIVVLRFIPLVIRDIEVYRVVPGLGYPPSVVLQWLVDIVSSYPTRALYISPPNPAPPRSGRRH